ncbi:MAG TPA: DnaA/Hda family protein, partial [Planctomycetota bacterium]|nr:DnaA/Hda family protein [Planctomycetota bacterium]
MPLLDAETRRLLLEEVAREVDPVFFETWCAGLDLVRVEPGLIEVPCATRYCRDLLEPRLGDPLKRAVSKLLGGEPRIVFKVDDDAAGRELPADSSPPVPRPRRADPALPGIPLREDLTFDTLIEGPSNRFAIAAGMQIANEPFEHPMFLY